MTAVIHQPDFLPYLGFFHRLLYADVYVILDNVQYLRGSKSWHNRDKIKTSSGECWLTVPTIKAPQKTPLNKILISNDHEWKRNHLNLLYHNYRRADCFDEIFPFVELLYSGKEELLMDFTLNSIKLLMDLLDIEIQMVLASETGAVGRNNDLLVDILSKIKTDEYLSGIGAKEYFDPVPFARAGIKVVWQNFAHPEYPQQFGPFIPYLSSIDLLFNCGIVKSRHVLRSI